MYGPVTYPKWNLCGKYIGYTRGTSILGFSLIETLIALLVISIGLAGMAALHLNSLRNTHSSYLRSIASSAALDFEERAWLEAATTNGCPVIDSAYANAFQADWRADNANDLIGLPALDVTITENPTASTRRWEGQLTIEWAEGRFADANENQSKETFEYVFSVFCSEVI